MILLLHRPFHSMSGMLRELAHGERITVMCVGVVQSTENHSVQTRSNPVTGGSWCNPDQYSAVFALMNRRTLQSFPRTFRHRPGP